MLLRCSLDFSVASLHRNDFFMGSSQKKIKVVLLRFLFLPGIEIK